MRIENARRPFHDQAMKVVRPDRFPKRFAESVQEIENQRLFDLDFLFRPLEHVDAARERPHAQGPPDQRRYEQREKENWPHGKPASLLRRCLVMKVLL